MSKLYCERSPNPRLLDNLSSNHQRIYVESEQVKWKEGERDRAMDSEREGGGGRVSIGLKWFWRGLEMTF